MRLQSSAYLSKTQSKNSQGSLQRSGAKGRKGNDQIPQNGLKSNPYFPYDPITGYIDIYEEEGNSMFYWLSPARENPDTAPVIIWLEGGSAVSSLFRYLGPLEVKNYPEGGKKATIRKISWNQKANLLFADYPLGIGFSTSTADHIPLTRKDLQDQMLRFYQGFLEKHPQYKGRDIYVGGESFGGHTASYTAYALKY